MDPRQRGRATGDSKCNQLLQGVLFTEVQKNEEIASRGLFKGRRYSMLDADGKDPVKRNKRMMQERKGELLEQCHGAEVTE